MARPRVCATLCWESNARGRIKVIVLRPAAHRREGKGRDGKGSGVHVWLCRPGVTERKWDEQQEGLEQGAPVPGTSLSKVITEQGQAFESVSRVTHRDSHHYKAF